MHLVVMLNKQGVHVNAFIISPTVLPGLNKVSWYFNKRIPRRLGLNLTFIHLSKYWVLITSCF